MGPSITDKLNRYFEGKKFTWCGDFLVGGDDDSCYEFSVKLKEIKPMISVGEWRDFVIVDITVYAHPDSILYIFANERGLGPKFGGLEWGIKNKLNSVIKNFGDYKTHINNIKVESNKTENITEQRITNNMIRNIIRDISFEVKKDFNKKRTMNIGTFDVGLTDPIDIDLHINFLPKNPKVKKPFDIEGFWNDETNELEIFITFDENVDSSIMYDLIGDLNDVVTHELQHVKQTKRGVEFSQKNYKQPKRYYLQPDEIEAQVAGFKRKAKLQKRPLEDVIREYFKSRGIRKKLIDLFVERLMNFQNN